MFKNIVRRIKNTKRCKSNPISKLSQTSPKIWATINKTPVKINAAVVSVSSGFTSTSLSLIASFELSIINSPFPVRLGLASPNFLSKAPHNIAKTLAILKIEIAKANHSDAGLPVFEAHISDIGTAPAPVPPPIIGST